MVPMSDWSIEKVFALAPDAGSASAGQALASIRKWTRVESSPRALWGLCQGSGKDPYQVRIDLGEPAFKCSCPSRKFPCKHGIALLLLYAKEQSSFVSTAEPAWVSEWLDSRTQRAEQKIEKAKAAAQTPVDPVAQAKRAAQRDERVLRGVEECRTLIEDIIRRGLSALQRENNIEWHRIAARMVDAQAPGLAGYLEKFQYAFTSGEGSELRALKFLGRLHVLLTAATRMKELPSDLAGDVRVSLGYPQSKDDVLASTGIADTWTVLGQTYDELDKVTARSTWLWGSRTGRSALILDFAAGTQSLDMSLIPGMAFEGEVAFYASRLPMRALVKSQQAVQSANQHFVYNNDGLIASGLLSFAKALGQIPWLARWPMVLIGAEVARDHNRWCLRQGEQILPLSSKFCSGIHLWRMITAIQNRKATIAVEWDGEVAFPVGAFLDGAETVYVNLVSRRAA